MRPTLCRDFTTDRVSNAQLETYAQREAQLLEQQVGLVPYAELARRIDDLLQRAPDFPKGYFLRYAPRVRVAEAGARA